MILAGRKMFENWLPGIRFFGVRFFSAKFTHLLRALCLSYSFLWCQICLCLVV